MKIKTVVEIISAAHMTYLVDSPKEFGARGGVMFVAPVGHLKTVITKTLDLWQPAALVLSDLTIRKLIDMRDAISANKIRTLAFMELPKLYGRNQEVASNIEGALQQMADEGFRSANFEDQDAVVREARALIVGAMPPAFYRKHWGDWVKSGWSRRFLWCHFQLADPEILMESVDRWQPLDFGKIITAMPATRSIPFTVTPKESAFCRDILRQTKGGYEVVPFQLLKKIFAVIKWRYSELGTTAATGKAIETIGDFSQSLRGVCDLQLDLSMTEPDTDGMEVGKPAVAAGAARQPIRRA